MRVMHTCSWSKSGAYPEFAGGGCWEGREPNLYQRGGPGLRRRSQHVFSTSALKMIQNCAKTTILISYKIMATANGIFNSNHFKAQKHCYDVHGFDYTD